MRFETAQVLEIARLSKDTLRHWKKILSPISRVDGRSNRYELCELVALCAISRATQDLGVNISQIAKSAPWLFAEAAARQAVGYENDVIHLLPDGTGVWSKQQPSDFETAITIRVNPILTQIKLASQPELGESSQLVLPL